MSTYPKKLLGLTDIEGVGKIYSDKLKQYGVHSLKDLLRKAGTSRERIKMSSATGIPASTILRWACQAELLIIDGIDPEYVALLVAAGVDSAPELVLRDPKTLHDKMVRVNKQKNLVRNVPLEKEIARWVKQILKSPYRLSF
jgi:hypothetical protein